MHGPVKREEKELVLRPSMGLAPPNNTDAEGSVLSTLLLDPERYDEVAGLLLGGSAFYSDQNRRIYEVIVRLREAGTPVDAVTVARELQATGRLAQAGGMPYLSMLIGSIPAVANVVAHAEIVRDLYTRRQLIARAQTIAAETYTAEGSAVSLVLSAESSLAELALQGAKTPLIRVGTVLDSEVDRLAKAEREGVTFSGLDTGFPKLNAMTGGLQKGDLIIVAARPGMGKAQRLTSPVLTPTGYRQMGSLAVGDFVIGSDRRAHRVTGIFEQGVLPVYKLYIDGGLTTECTDGHLWYTTTDTDRKLGRAGAIRTLSDIRATLADHHLVPVDGSSRHTRMILAIAPVDPGPCRCITVSAPDRLYVTNDGILTHNSAFVLNVSANVGRGAHGKPGKGVAFFSLEMPKEQLALRLACAEQNIDYSLLRSGRIPAETWNKLTEAATAIASMAVWIDDSPGITVQDVRTRARKLQRDIALGRTDKPADDLGLVVIDYMQLAQGRRQKGDTRETEVASISRDLKGLAKDLGVPVMALSQLNRSVEQRPPDDRRPRMSDLRESGALEQDADGIWFLYRDEYYNEQAAKGEAELIFAKQRNGSLGTVPLFFRGPAMRFYERYGAGSDDDEFGEFDAGV